MKPLEGKRILITRTKSQAQDFAKKLKSLGGIPVIIPLISIQPPVDATPIRQAIKRIHDFDWLVLTSQNGVHAFFRYANEEGVSPNQIADVKVAVVGKKTLHALETYGVTADVVPENIFTAEALLEALLPKLAKGDRVLLARGNLARAVLPEQLRDKRNAVVDVVAYETIINRSGKRELLDLLAARGLDVITFTSSSTVHHFVSLVKEHDWQQALKPICLAAIGPITANTMREHGLKPDVVAARYTTAGLIDGIIRYYRTLHKG